MFNCVYSICQVLLVFDVTSRKSFDDLDGWLEEANLFGCKYNSVPVVVCGNKIDKGKRTVSESEAQSWANSKRFPYFETSASSGANVQEVFQTLFQSILNT